MDRMWERPSVSRREALRLLARCGVGVGALAAVRLQAGAAPFEVDAAPDHHPIVGYWLAATPMGPAEMLFTADGDAGITWCHAQDGIPGDFFHTHGATGTWAAVSDRAVRFSVIQLNRNDEGVESGTTTVEGNPTVSEDGLSFQTTHLEITLDASDAGWPGPLSAIRMRGEATCPSPATPAADPEPA